MSGGHSAPLSQSTAQLAHLLIKHLRCARQRGAHVPQHDSWVLSAGGRTGMIEPRGFAQALPGGANMKTASDLGINNGGCC